MTCSGGVSDVINEKHSGENVNLQIDMANNPNTVLKHDYKNSPIKLYKGFVNKFKFFICVLINIQNKYQSLTFSLTSSFAFHVRFNIAI